MKSDMPNIFKNIAQDKSQQDSAAAQPGELSLAGRSAWIISDGITGHLAITRGVAETLGLIAEIKPVSPRMPWRHLAPNGPADPRILRSLLAEPQPDIVLGAGRQTVPIIRALKRAGAFTVIFQSPRASSKSADLIWVPAHDKLRGPNVITTLTPPHRFTASRLQALRETVPATIAALPTPRMTLLLGGPGAGYRYDTATIDAFAHSLTHFAQEAGSFMITASRRTPPELFQAADEATRETPRILWDGNGENPYPHFLACADLLIVTADSVNMIGEACATGRPVYVFHPAGGRRKFVHYHQALQDYGATRPLPENPGPLATWHYEPLQPSAFVAAEIEARWRRFQSTKPQR